jgi:hypothetical protein
VWNALTQFESHAIRVTLRGAGAASILLRRSELPRIGLVPGPLPDARNGCWQNRAVETASSVWIEARNPGLDRGQLHPMMEHGAHGSLIPISPDPPW